MAANAARGRKAVPRNLKLIQGRAPGKDSGGRPVPAEIPFQRGALVKPAELSKDAAWLWDLVVEQLESVGLLKPLDAASLEAVCEVFARLRYAVRERELRGMFSTNVGGAEVVAPWVRIEAEASRDFRSWCAEYGLTPAAEKNLRNGDDDGGLKDNPFE